MKFGEDGRLYAINPEAGFFGVAPGTGEQTNPNAIRTIERNSIFTNCARTDDGDVWWEGLTQRAARAPDRLARQRLDAGLARRPRRTPTRASPTPAAQDPAIAPEWEDPAGVPIDAMLFGGRRSTVVPLVTEALDWEHGVFLGSVMSSEKTAAAAGTVGRAALRPVRDAARSAATTWPTTSPTGCRSGGTTGAKLPKIFYVNWFRKDADGRFLWPGYGENSRVLAWVFARCAGHGAAAETPIGLIPPVGGEGIDTRGLDVSEEDMAELLRVDTEEWHAQLPHFHEHFAKFERPARRAARPAARRSRARLARLAPAQLVVVANRAPCVSPAAAGGRDSSASEVIVSAPRAADSSTSVASSSERAYSSTSRCTMMRASSSCLWKRTCVKNSRTPWSPNAA